MPGTRGRNESSRPVESSSYPATRWLATLVPGQAHGRPIADRGLSARLAMVRSAAQTIIGLSRGERPAENVVNPEVRNKSHW